MEYLSKLTKIAIPMLASSLVIIFTNLLNVRLLGQLNPKYFYILALYLPLYYLLTCFFESARVSVIYFYSDSKLKTSTPLIAVVGLLILSLVLLTLLYWQFFPLVAKIYHVSDNQQLLLKLFSLSMIVASIFTGISYLLASVLYAKTHSYSALAISLLTSLLNLTLTYSFSHYYHYGLLSLALATLISSGAFSLVLLVMLIKKRLINYSTINSSMILAYWGDCFRLSFPVFMSAVITFVGFSLLTQIASHFSESAVAGFGLALRIQAIVILPAISLAIATAVLYRQSNNTNFKAVRQSLFYVFIVYLLIALILFLFRNGITSFLVKDHSVQQYCENYLYWVALSYIGFGGMLFCLTLFEQIGFGKRALVINTFWFLVEIIVGGFLAFHNYSLYQLFIVIALMNFISIPTVTFLLLREKSYGLIKLSTN